MRLNLADINECIEGTSNCSADAVCNNTKGSYNCTCKPGYSGDGRTCEAWVNVTKVFILVDEQGMMETKETNLNPKNVQISRGV